MNSRSRGQFYECSCSNIAQLVENIKALPVSLANKRIHVDLHSFKQKQFQPLISHLSSLPATITDVKPNVLITEMEDSIIYVHLFNDCISKTPRERVASPLSLANGELGIFDLNNHRKPIRKRYERENIPIVNTVTPFDKLRFVGTPFKMYSIEEKGSYVKKRVIKIERITKSHYKSTVVDPSPKDNGYCEICKMNFYSASKHRKCSEHQRLAVGSEASWLFVDKLLGSCNYLSR